MNIEGFSRSVALHKISAARNENKMVLVQGLRRIGKSELLLQVAQTLRIEKPPVKIVFVKPINQNYSARNLLTEARSLGVGPCALIIDNADYIIGLKEALSEIQRRYKPWIVLSGKHSQVLAPTLFSFFSPLIMELPPLSFREYLALSEQQKNIEIPPTLANLTRYMCTGGIPENIAIEENLNLARRYQNLFVYSLLYTEILETGRLRNAHILKLVLGIIVRLCGAPISARLICSELAKLHYSISPTSALDYIGELAQSKLIIEVPLYDINFKKILETGLVYYPADSGIRTAVISSQENNSKNETEQYTPAEFDALLKNCIFLYVYYNYAQVYKGRVSIDSRQKETIDFICEDKNGRVYIQVLGKNENTTRVYKAKQALLSIKDSWPKIIVSSQLSELYKDGKDADGIVYVSPIDLLLVMKKL